VPLRGILYLMLVAFGLILTIRKPFNGIITYCLMNMLRPELFSYGALITFKLHTLVYIIILISIFVNIKSIIENFKIRSPIIIFLFLMLFFQFLSSFGATYQDYSLAYNKELAKILLFCFLMAGLTKTEQDLNKLFIAFMIGSGLLALWGFKQHFGWNARLEGIGGGSTDTSNGIALLFLLFMPLFLYRALSPNRIVKLISLAMSGVFLAVVVFTQSRSAFVGLIVMAFYVFTQVKIKKNIRGFFLLLAIPIFFYAAQSTSFRGESYIERIQNMVDKGMDVDQSASGRKDIWHAAWLMFKDNVLWGVGQKHYKFKAISYMNQNVQQSYQNLGKTVVDAHNTFLLILAEGGIFALVFFLLAIFYYFLELWRIKRMYKQQDNKVYNMAVFLEGSMIGFIFCGMAHSYGKVEYIYWFLTIPIILKNVYLIDLPGKLISGSRTKYQPLSS